MSSERPYWITLKPVGSFAGRSLHMSDGANVEKLAGVIFARPSAIEWYATPELGPSKLDTGSEFSGAKALVRVHPASAAPSHSNGEVGSLEWFEREPPGVCNLHLYVSAERYEAIWAEARDGRLPHVHVQVPFGEGITSVEDANSLGVVWHTKKHPSLRVLSWDCYFSSGRQPEEGKLDVRMLTAERLDREASPSPPVFFEALRIAWLLSPFAVKVLAGFEWAVLLALLVGTHQICALLRGVILDTTTLNLIKRYENKVWDP